MPNSFGHHFPPEVESLIAEQESKRVFHGDLDRTMHAMFKAGVPPEEAARILGDHWHEDGSSDDQPA